MAYTVSSDLVGNGTTLTFGETELGPLVDANPNFTAAEIDVSGLADDEDVFELGSVAKRLECTVIGDVSSQVEIGDKGDVTVGLKNGGEYDVGYCVLSASPVTITRNGRIETKLTFIRTRKDAS